MFSRRVQSMVTLLRKVSTSDDLSSLSIFQFKNDPEAGLGG